MTMQEILQEGFAKLSVPFDERASKELHAYYQLLDEKNKVMNLTAINGEEDTARLHFLDCGALLTAVPFQGKRVIDIGSGAGFPGLVLRLLEPTMELTMLDSLRKRVDFQKEVCEALQLSNVTCLHARAEEATELRERFDIATSRAVARLNLLCELCLPFVKKGGCFVAMKGPAAEEELKEAAHAIAFLGGEVEAICPYTIPGTDIVHSAVVIRKIKNTPPKYPRRWANIQKAPL